MDAIRSFLAMGGYGAYVWPCYLLAAAVMVGLLVVSLRTARRRESELDRLQRLRQDRPARRPKRPGRAATPEGSTP